MFFTFLFLTFGYGVTFEYMDCPKPHLNFLVEKLSGTWYLVSGNDRQPWEHCFTLIIVPASSDESFFKVLRRTVMAPDDGCAFASDSIASYIDSVFTYSFAWSLRRYKFVVLRADYKSYMVACEIPTNYGIDDMMRRSSFTPSIGRIRIFSRTPKIKPQLLSNLTDVIQDYDEFKDVRLLNFYEDCRAGDTYRELISYQD